MKAPSVFSHIRDIFILPFSVTVVVPYFIHPVSWFEKNYLLLDIAGVTIGLAGFLLFASTVFLFGTIGKGTLAPWSPKQKLVVVGPYKYCRNPMITGVLFILIGETMFFQSSGLLIWVCVFFLINTTYFILVEEPDLENRFGEDYRRYKKAVSRWMPALRPYAG